MYSRSRLDALGDGIFAVAMTLLALDIRLPDDFAPRNSAELFSGVLALGPKFLPYALSFFVLGLRWLWEAEERGHRPLSGGYARGWLVLLFLVTCLPFTTIVIGRYASVPAAIWLYIANIALLSLVSFLLARVADEPDHKRRRARAVGLATLLVSGAAAIALSFIDPSKAMWALTLNFFSPAINRWTARA